MKIVDSKRIAAALAALTLLFAACSDPQGTEPGDAAAPSAGETGGAESSSGDGGKGAGEVSPGAGAGKGSGSGAGKSGSGSGGSGGSGGGGPRGSGGGDPSLAGGPRGSAGYPAEGEYSYAQEGFERFCQGPSCSKEPLPPTATITASDASRSSGGVTVVTESRSSDRQTITTTTRYTAESALVTNVVIDFAFGSFNYSQEYAPQPPVESLSYPLEVGKSWRGRWKAQTSGDYRMNVLAEEDGVFRIATVTNFRGDFSGRAQATVWVDESTGVVVRTDGDVAVASRFGEYTSSFRTTLQSGPGY